jgi:DNA-directed RNA polymerase subunit RPC12/RpoP
VHETPPKKAEQAADDPPAPPAAETPGRSIDDGRGRVFPCEQCGGELVFNIGDQRLKCPHCGFEKEIVVPKDAAVAEQDFQAMLDRLQEQRASGDQAEKREETQNHVCCESCGATVVFVGTLTSLECPYCGSPILREHIHTGGWRVPVDGVLPFAVVRERAAENFVGWARSRWFAPNEFVKRADSGKFNGVYLPFWTYDAVTASTYRGRRGEWYLVTVGSGKDERQERRTRWWPVAGQFQLVFDDILVAATSGIRRDLIDGLSPWPLDRCLPFTQDVLAGFMARTYDVDLKDGFDQARTHIDSAIANEARTRIGGDEQIVDNIQTAFGAITFKHLLLPVWLMAYRYQERTYQVLVNASTGEVDGERPYSSWKIAAAVVSGLLLALALVYFYNQR